MSASVCIFILLIAERAEQENGRKEISSNAFANLTFHSCHNLIFCPFLCLAGLLKHYNTSHPDYQNTNMAMVKIQSVIRKMSVKLRESVRILFTKDLQKTHLGISCYGTHLKACLLISESP